MRLSQEQRATILRVARELFGDQARVRLFGSRARDELKGGDIDLLVELPVLPPDNAWQTARMQAALQMNLGEQKIDVVLAGPENRAQPIVEEAMRTGVAL
jgi:predicted nucleotidyltransferase